MDSPQQDQNSVIIEINDIDKIEPEPEFREDILIENVESVGLENCLTSVGPENEDEDEDYERRLEEPWTNTRENLIKEWRIHVDEMYKLHEEAAYRQKSKHHLIGLPTIIIPLIMTFVQVVFEVVKTEHLEIYTVINAGMWLISSVLAIIYKSLDLGTQHALHFQYSARYYELIIRIDSELSRKREFRKSADAFITELRCQIDNLNQSGPDMPFNSCWFW